jgi:hypothetical protein
MTTGFDQQPTTFGQTVKTAPRPQTVGAKLPPPRSEPPTQREPRSFERR